MENLIEKLKTVDKKVWIGVGIGAAVLIIIIVALVIGGGNKPASGNTQGTQVGTETEGSSEVFGTEDVTEVIGTEEATETEMGTETEMSEVEGQTQGGTSTNVTVTQPEAVGGVEQKPVTTTNDGQEIFGLGSASQPYEVIPDLNTMSVTTVEVPAGKTLYYKIQRVGGMWFNIDDSDLYVIDSAGNRHDSGFKVENALASDYVLFQVGNKGGANKSFTLKFSNIQGSYQNPEKIASVGTFAKHLDRGNEVGYYYKYYAQQAGVLRFYISATEASDICITNNRNSAMRTIKIDPKVDETGRECTEIEVQPGDELLILIHAMQDDRGRYPATDITWEMKYK